MPVLFDAAKVKREAREELRRRRMFERYRYYKIPHYLLEAAKSDAHTKLLPLPNKVGKTTFAAFNAYWYAMGCHPFRVIRTPNVFWLLGPTLNHVNEVFIATMREWGLDKFWASYSEKRGKIVWTNGSVTYCKSYDDRKNIQGRVIKAAFIDEECPNDIWTEITFRFKAGEQMDIMVTATPIEGEEWFDDMCYMAERGDKGLFINQEVSIWDAHVDKGGHLTGEDIDRIARLCIDDLDRQVRLHGKRIRRAGAYLPLDEKIHKFSPMKLAGGKIPNDWIRIVGIDPHPRKPTSMVWIALDTANGDAYVYDHAKVEGTTKNHAEFLRERNKGQNIFAMYIDPASKRAMQSNLQSLNWNYYDELCLEYPEVPIMLSVSDPDLVGDAVRMRLSYDTNKPVSPVNRPHLYILDYLEPLWTSLRSVRWQEYRDRSLTGMKESMKKGKEDDLMALGYALVKHPIYVPPSAFIRDYVPVQPQVAENSNVIHQEMGY